MAKAAAMINHLVTTRATIQLDILSKLIWAARQLFKTKAL
ncbi:hypothetical protein ABI_36720 [Asticcacaulis biprosthecium C19]|uniref:Transposase n=1 Tax=Asticcacaulis biprosthecium C19 TaxID=715226 RepID=F4QR05_9CAUL|nr:hypothetical protein ABI_36720 [Asticcacaulis biprosthecium C19]